MQIGQQGATAQPGNSVMIVVAVAVVIIVAIAVVWWMKRTKGGRRAP